MYPGDETSADIDLIEFISPEDDLMLALSNAGEAEQALKIAQSGRVELTKEHVRRAVEMGHVDFVSYAIHEKRLFPEQETLRHWVELGDLGSISILLHAGLPPEMFGFITTEGLDARTVIKNHAAGHYPETIALLEGIKKWSPSARRNTYI